MAEKQSFITLLTDFGVQDHYVASMKGVIYRINPSATIVDITHHIPPQDIESGAFQLLFSYSYFPKGTIHVVVVDPGVGSNRDIVAAKTQNYFFLAPNNGILSTVLKEEKKVIIRKVINKKYFLPSVSSTFHGRDIFSPVAAHLSMKDIFHHLGPIVRNIKVLKSSKVQKRPTIITGCVVYIDRFGNLITNIPADSIKENTVCTTEIKGTCIKGISQSYASVTKGELGVVKGSSHLIEIAQREASAENTLKVKRGTKVIIRL